MTMRSARARSRQNTPWLAAGAIACGLLGCSDPAPPAATFAPPPPVPVLPIAAPRPVSSSIAFDLVSTPGGAVMVWGTPARQGGGVRALALDPSGAPRGTEVDVVRRGEARSGSAEEAPAQIEELTIASSGTRVGLAWVLGGPTPIVQATFSPQEVEGFAPPRTLAPTTSLVPGSRAARGRIAMSSREDGALVVTHRLADARCSEAAVAEAGASGGATCARIARSEIDSLVAELEPTTEMEVPDRLHLRGLPPRRPPERERPGRHPRESALDRGADRRRPEAHRGHQLRVRQVGAADVGRGPGLPHGGEAGRRDLLGPGAQRARPRAGAGRRESMKRPCS
jgi:hypothetical protein